MLIINVVQVTPLDRETSGMARRIKEGQEAERAALTKFLELQSRLPEPRFVEGVRAAISQGAESWGRLWKPFRKNHRRLVRARTGERLGLWLSALLCIAAAIALARRTRLKEGRRGRFLAAALVCLGAWVLTGAQVARSERLAYRDPSVSPTAPTAGSTCPRATCSSRLPRTPTATKAQTRHGDRHYSAARRRRDPSPPPRGRRRPRSPIVSHE